MGVTFSHKGNFSALDRFLLNAKKAVGVVDYDRYAKMGVAALRGATPVDTGLTAASWTYEIVKMDEQVTLNFINTNVQNHIPIAIIIDTGHATRNGGWVSGRHYIDPAIRPVFDEITKQLWEEVTSS